MKNYQFILWDWDGCLAKTLQIHLDSYKKAFAKFNLYPTNRDITHKVFGDWNGPKKVGIKNKDIKKITEIYLQQLNKAYPLTKLNRYGKEILDYLASKNKKMALITTLKTKTLLPALKNNNVGSYFKTILSAEDVKKHKPDPEIIFKAIKKLRGSRNKTIIIGDSKSDLGAAKNAQIDSVLFYPKTHKIFYDLKMLKTYQPTYIISDLIELKNIIRPNLAH